MDLWRLYVNMCGFSIELAAYQEDGSFVLSRLRLAENVSYK